MFKTVLGCATALAAFAAVPAEAQEQARLNWAEVHSAAIEGNLEGNSAGRKVLVVTPPGYDENSGKRYPVVYFLHGYWMPVEAQQEPLLALALVLCPAVLRAKILMRLSLGVQRRSKPPKCSIHRRIDGKTDSSKPL